MQSKLAIFTFGGFEAWLDGQTVTGFRSRKAIALLAYLAAHLQPQPRESIAELFWEERPQSQSLSNLRVVLSNLRKILGDFLDIRRDKIGLRRNDNLWIDIAALETCLDRQQPEAGMEIYRGDFLQGFYVPDARKFDAWLVIEREKYQQKIVSALQGLVVANRRLGDYPAAISFARRLIELDHLNEAGHLELLHLLTLTGQRTEAMARFGAYRTLLKEELGLEPSRELAALADQLQSGQVVSLPALEDAAPQRLPAALQFPQSHGTGSPTENKVFVGRQRELAELETHLRQALNGNGKVIFISGEAGSGKSALMQEFARRAQEQLPTLLVVSGSCTVFSGTGDPYSPFRDILAQLTGDVEPSPWAETMEIAQKLWLGKEATLQAILQHGPDLIGSFILPGIIIKEVNAGGSKWQKELLELTRQKMNPPDHSFTNPANLLDQYATVLAATAAYQPLLVLIDDLQWADPSSVSLLCHLSRRIHSSPILIVGAYRPEDTADLHNPFGSSLNEFKRQSGDRRIDLDRRSRAEGQDFVNALIDTQPNRLDQGFRQRFAQQSGGHALFTVELLRELKQNGLLIQDEQGLWIEQDRMNWGSLPARVEAVIEMRTRQLTAEMNGVLKTASVIGEEFSAEIISRVIGMDTFTLLRQMNDDLAGKSRLVREMGIIQVGQQRLSQFRFCHGLFQRYFYNLAGEAERAYLHERVGLVLEDLYKDQPEELASASPRLAWHFQQAGLAEKAVDYQLMAGNRAAQLGASEDALSHYQRGIELLPSLSDSNLRISRELALRLASCAPLQALKGYTDPEVRSAYERVKELTSQLRKKLDLLPTLYFLRTFHHTLQERQASFDLAKEILNAADPTIDPCLVVVAHWALGSELAYRGDFQQARVHLEQAAETFDSKKYGWLVNFYGNDPGIAARARLSWVLWFLGYPDQARQASQAALAMAEKSNNPLVRGFAIGRAGVMFHQIIGEVEEARKWNTASRKFSEHTRASIFNPAELISAGWIKSETGEVKEGVEMMRQGLDAWHTSGAVMHLPHYLAMYASGLLRAGLVDEGLNAIIEGLKVAEENNERYYESELWRIRGELLARKMDITGSESAFKTAIQVARAQDAKSLEGLASMSLSRVLSRKSNSPQTDKMR